MKKQHGASNDGPGFDIYALRIGNVIEPHEYAELFPHYFKHPEVRRRNAFCYIDARDLGQIVDLCLKKDGLGYQVFNAGNDHNGAILPTKELAERFFPNVPITRELGEHEALFSNRKIREVLGFKEQHNWQKYVKRSVNGHPVMYVGLMTFLVENKSKNL